MTAAVSTAAPTAGAACAGAARTAVPVGSGWFIPVARAPRSLPASRRRRLRSAGRGNLLNEIQCHLGIDMPVGMDRIFSQVRILDTIVIFKHVFQRPVGQFTLLLLAGGEFLT